MSKPVVVRFLGDASDFERAARQVSGAGEKTGSKLKSLFGPAMLAGGAAAVASFGKSSVAAFKESETAQSQLAAALAKFPATADTNARSLGRINEQLARKTKFDDDATASGQAVLAGFNLTGKQIEKLTPLLQDYAARTGKDLPTAATDLGKAMQGQGKALKAVGIQFKDTGSQAGNFDSLMGSLNAKVGGFATKEGATAAGKAQILSNQFGELQEKVGSALLPVLVKLGDVLLGVVTWFQNLNPGVQTAIGVVIGLAAAVAIISKAMQAWAVVQGVLNAVMLMNPIGLVIIAIAALVAGIVIAYRNSETFRNIVQGAFRAVVTAAGWVRDAVVGAFDLVRGALTKAQPAFEAIKTILSFLANLADKVAGALGRVAGAAGKVVGAVGKVGGLVGGAVGRIPGLAHGGTAHAMQPYIVGERGPELFVPGATGTVVPNNAVRGMGQTVIHINMPPGSDGQDVVDAITRWERRNGKLYARA